MLRTLREVLLLGLVLYAAQLSRPVSAADARHISY